jgi:hypothetical protein
MGGGEPKKKKKKDTRVEYKMEISISSHHRRA